MLAFLFCLRWRTCHPVSSVWPFFFISGGGPATLLLSLIYKNPKRKSIGGLQNPLAFGHSQLHKCIGCGSHFRGF